MPEPRFTLHQVVEAVQAAQADMRKSMRKVLAFRTFVASLCGFMVIGLLLVSGAPAPLAVFGGAGMVTMLFFTIDFTGETIFEYVQKRMKGKDDGTSNDDSSSDDSGKAD